ncbi:MAG: hypothetical protein EOP20_13550 [Hyphomicrobiales bacterium]|nr:MAG: hypothetical protein EOP20_13550 [Hyphomicrobiales bacterium]
MTQFSLFDCRGDEIATEVLVKARSPEEAALLGLGENLTRGGHHRNLVCRVYWDDGAGKRNMVRLYSRSIPR